jgi:hypothetical protein
MGKTFRSFDRSETFDWHDPETESLRRRAKRAQVREDRPNHADRRTDHFERLDAVVEERTERDRR